MNLHEIKLITSLITWKYFVPFSLDADSIRYPGTGTRPNVAHRFECFSTLENQFPIREFANFATKRYYTVYRVK